MKRWMIKRGFDFQEFFENINGNAQLHVHCYLIHLGYMFIFHLSSITFWTSLKSVGKGKINFEIQDLHPPGWMFES